MTRGETLVWLAGVFDEPLENLRADTSRDQIAGWDSLGVLTLMADLDEKFDIQAAEQDMAAMTSVQDVLELLGRHGKLSA